MAIHYDDVEDEVWPVRIVVAPTLEDGGRVIARAGAHENRLRELFGPVDTHCCDVE